MILEIPSSRLPQGMHSSYTEVLYIKLYIAGVWEEKRNRLFLYCKNHISTNRVRIGSAGKTSVTTQDKHIYTQRY